jgi:hypothetical protein
MTASTHIRRAISPIAGCLILQDDGPTAVLVPKPQPGQLGHRIAGFGNALLYVDTEGRLILRPHMLAFVFLVRDNSQQLAFGNRSLGPQNYEHHHSCTTSGARPSPVVQASSEWRAAPCAEASVR